MMHFYIQIHDRPFSLHISNSKSKPVIGPHLPTPGVTCFWCSRQLCSFPCQQHLMCAGLWCLVEGDTSCKTKLDPPLDGTECGADKVTPASHSPPPAPSPGHQARLLKGRWSALYSGVPETPRGQPQKGPWSPLWAKMDTSITFLLFFSGKI